MTCEAVLLMTAIEDHETQQPAAEPTDAQPVAWSIRTGDLVFLSPVQPPAYIEQAGAIVTPLCTHPRADAAPDPQPKGFRADLHDSKGSISDAALAETTDYYVKREAADLAERNALHEQIAAQAEQVRVLREALLRCHPCPACGNQVRGISATAPDGEAQ